MPRVLKPLSEWIAKRYVSPAESARPGQWDNDTTPFAVPVMDAFSNPKVERITMVGSSQVVKTEIIKNIIAYIIDNNMGPLLVVYPSDGAAREFSVEKLEPMIAHNKFLRDKIAPAKPNSKENKTLYKKFGPYFLAIVGGNVPQDLARRSVKYVIADDRDRIGTAGNEGDAVELAWQRTESYAFLGRKRVEISSPTIENASPIMDSYELSDQGEWFVPCPHCDHYQTFKFENFVWDKTEEKDLFNNVTKKIHRPETVKLKCENCAELIDEKHKQWMVSSGKRVCKFPERVEHFGLKNINRMYSFFSPWSGIVKEYLDSKNNRPKRQVFWNTVMGITWKLDVSETIDENILLNRLEDYLTEDKPFLPNKILYLTCAVDTQGDRLEVQVEGWGYEEENWVVHYVQLWGDPDMQDVWNQLDEFLTKTWQREDGATLQIGGYYLGKRFFATFIDSQGKSAKSVYDYCLHRQHKGIFSIKGRGGTGLPPVINRSKVGQYRQTILINLGVDSIKEVIWSRLKRFPKDEQGNFKGGPKTCHFTREFCDEIYFKMLLAERPLLNDDRRGNQIILWKKFPAGARNEPWDLKVYNYAAYLYSNVNLRQVDEAIRNEMMKQKVDEPKPQQAGKPLFKKNTGMRVTKGFINSWNE